MAKVSNIILYLFAALLLCIAIYIHSITSGYGDKLWELLYARRWLDGKHLYTDIFPVSPPLIFWMYALPVAVSKHLSSLRDLQVFFLMGMCLLAFSLFISTRLIALHPAFVNKKSKQIEFIILFCFVFIFRANPHYFLDREHLFIVLVFPYLMRWMPSLSPVSLPLWMRIVIGCMAGIGFCIKPQCFIIFAGVQLLFFFREYSCRIIGSIENCIVYVSGVSYLLSVWLLYPEYFSIVVPMALTTYSATRDVTPVFSYCENSLSILVLAFLMFRLRHTSPYRQDIFYFVGLCPFLFFYTLTNNNWGYTYYPLGSIALIIAGFVLWEFVYLRNEYKSRGLPTWPSLEGICACIIGLSPFFFFYAIIHTNWANTDSLFGSIAIIIVSLVLWEFVYLKKYGLPTWLFPVGICVCILPFLFKIVLSMSYFSDIAMDGCYDNIHCLRDETLVAELKSDNNHFTSFGAISINFARWTRISRYSGATWDTRFPQLWMLPKFLISDEQFTHDHQWILDYVSNAFAEDMERRKPEVMFVEETTLYYTAHKYVDLVAYFSTNPKFREAWKHYRFIHNIDNTCGPPKSLSRIYKIDCNYDVYHRIP